MYDPKESNVPVEIKKTTSSPALGDKNLIPLVQGPKLPETRSQDFQQPPDEPMAPAATVPVPVALERQLNVLLALLWEFYDWLRQFREGQQLTADQRYELAQRMELAIQLRAVHENDLVKDLPVNVRRDLYDEFSEKFADVYAPVMNRARAIHESKTGVPSIDDEPKRERIDLMELASPTTDTASKLFQDAYKALEVFESAHAALALSWKNLMSRLFAMGNVRYLERTKDFRDRCVQLAKPPTLAVNRGD